MKQPTKKQLIELLRKIGQKFNEHQHEDSKLIRGYTLAANVEGLTELSNEIVRVTCRSK